MKDAKAAPAPAAPIEPPKTLIEALSRMQGELEPAAKDASNPHFKTKYADLASVREAIRLPMARNGLAVVQVFATPKEPGAIALETRVMHVSGESISSVLEMPVAQRTPQGVGSTITYARRYGLCALLGVVADDDDDGNAASLPRSQPPPRPAYAARATPPRQQARPVEAPTPAPAPQPAQAELTPWEAPGRAKGEWDDVLDAIEAAPNTKALAELRIKRGGSSWPEAVLVEWSMRNQALHAKERGGAK
jgi:hypothetical protein